MIKINHIKQQYLKQVFEEFEEDEVVKLLSEMIRIPGHKEIKWQEERMANYIYSFFQKENVEDLELNYIEENRPNITAVMPGEGNGESLMLNGHLDTIPPYSMVVPAYDPIIKDGYISGRGAVDMKGGLAAMMLAMALIKRAGIKLKGDLYFSGVIDQEQRSFGAVNLVEKGFEADYAIVGEPTNLKICRAHKGMEWIKIIVKGKSAHGSTPDKGINPIYHACRIAQEIETFNQELEERVHELVGHPTINVGVMTGGDDPNIVPSVSCLEMDRRYTPDEERKIIYQEIKKILARLNTIHSEYQTEIVSMDDRICPLGNQPLDTGKNNRLITALQKSVKEFSGEEAKITAFRGWSDAALFSRKLGITSVVFGPGLSENCHAADESLEISQLVKAVKMYAATIINLCC